MKTGAVKMSLTLSADVYRLLEEMCKAETRHKSRQISWLIKQYAAKKTPAPVRSVKRDGNIFYFPTEDKGNFRGCMASGNHNRRYTGTGEYHG